MQILGHEVAHCFMGLWHGPWFCGDVDDVELARSLSAESSDALLAALRQIMPRHADGLDLSSFTSLTHKQPASLQHQQSE